MKIMHLSDLHLGKNLNGFSLYEDQRHIHKQILQIAKEAVSLIQENDVIYIPSTTL
jgi:DNA repair exonuclease SbcCD nuclease subunit